MPSLMALAFNKSIEQEWIRRAIAGPSAPDFPLTAEQEAILAACRQARAEGRPLRLAIRARAGSGKTFILFEALRLLNAYPTGELRSGRTGAYLSSQEIKTSHALGLAAWKAKGLSISVFPGKDRAIAKELGLFKQPTSQEDSRPIALPAMALVAKAKTAGISPADRGSPLLPDEPASWEELAYQYGLSISPAILAAARSILSLSIDRGKKPHDVPLPGGRRTMRQVVELDFADMIYLPVLFAAPFDRYDLLALDEVQDFSPLRAALVARCVGPRSSVLAAGDPAQAIYAFTGADTRAMEHLSEQLGLQTLPLSISQRCATAVIACAQSIVPDIAARPSAPAGSVTHRPAEPLSVAALPSTILCRNNAPLIALGIYALTQRRPVALMGRDDILPQLQALLELSCGSGPSGCTIAQFRLGLQAHLQSVIRAKKRLPPTLRDNASALLALAASIEAERSAAAPASAILSVLDSLYAEDATLSALPARTLLLSTIHKSKGLEWPSVGILDAHLIGRYAEQEWEQEAESNLHYVAITRAITSLLYLSSDDIAGFSSAAIPALPIDDAAAAPEDDAAAAPEPALLF